MKPDKDKAALLTPYAVETRYPGDWLDITESEMQEALSIAEHTVLWAKGMISSGGDKT